MATNTVSKAQKEVFNEAVRGLVDSSVFTGVTSYAAGSTGTQAQGSNFGYTAGGFIPPTSNVIDKFPFASDANATDVGDTTAPNLRGGAGTSSSTFGYISGGAGFINTIHKFPFSVDGNSTDVGDLYEGRIFQSGQSSADNGYNSGGQISPTSPTVNNQVNTIDKFPFASDANATDVGNLTVARDGPAGQSSTENGYASGGWAGAPATTPVVYNVIDKFPFASDTNASDVGNLTVSRRFVGGTNSETEGYTSGGYNPNGTFYNTIDKFPFASDANATDVGDLTEVKYGPVGQSSTTSGYGSGGAGPPFNASNVIQKFPFASDANATDVGDLTVARSQVTGQQY
jgi:hypothetical protein